MNRKFQKECESSCEYMLPDYLGDVKKMLSSSARIVPSGEFDGDGELECAGIVVYDIVYLDSENKLSGASFSSDYDFKLQKNSESYLDSYVSSRVGNFVIRLTGPRRIIAKTNVVSDVYVMESFEETVSGNAFSEGDALEKITKTVKLESALKAEKHEREFAEEIASLEGVSADEIEVITSSAYVKISESLPVDGGVNIKGELIINALIRTPDTSVFAIRREIPFDETVSIAGDVKGASVISDGFVSSLTLGVNEAEASVSLVANAIVDFSALALDNESVELVSDAYLKTRDTREEYKSLTTSMHVISETKSGSAALKIPVSSLEGATLKEILLLNQDFKALALKNEGGEPKFEGEIAFSGVACEISEDESENLCALRFVSPASIDVNISCQIPENSELFAKILPAGCEWELDGENINVKLWYNLSYSVLVAKCERVLSSCEILGEAEYRKNLSEISVYYPDDNESLFDVAKKFHTSVKDIAADNDIAEPTALDLPLSFGLKRLIIR